MTQLENRKMELWAKSEDIRAHVLQTWNEDDDNDESGI